MDCRMPTRKNRGHDGGGRIDVSRSTCRQPGQVRPDREAVALARSLGVRAHAPSHGLPARQDAHRLEPDRLRRRTHRLQPPSHDSDRQLTAMTNPPRRTSRDRKHAKRSEVDTFVFSRDLCRRSRPRGPRGARSARDLRLVKANFSAAILYSSTACASLPARGRTP
jgi:hypothetical protein